MAAAQMDTIGGTANYNEPVGEQGNREKACGLDMAYGRSVHGLVKLAQIGLCFLAFLLSAITGGSVRGIFFSIITFCGFFFCLVIFFMFITECDKKVTRVNWYQADLLVSSIGTLLLFVISMTNVFSLSPLQIAASVFGFVAMVAFAISTWYAFQRWRQNRHVSEAKAEYDLEY